MRAQNESLPSRFQILGYSFGKQALRSLAGILMIQVSTGIVASWGNNNLYFLSYFNQIGQNVSPQTNSYILLATVIPMCFFTLLATTLCDKFGYEFMIKLCSFIFLLSPLIAQIHLTMWFSIIFTVFIPASAFALSTIPVFNTLWGHFMPLKNQATALCIILFSSGGILWNLLFVYLVNPMNKSADIKGQKMDFFDEEVTQNVPRSIFFIYFISGMLFVIGAFLIQRNYQVRTSPQMINLNIQSGNYHQQVPNNEEQSRKTQLRTALKDPRFILMFLISLLMGLYPVYLINNLKIVYMPIIKDDHFLAYCIILYNVTSMFGAYVWGFIGDKYGFGFSILIISVMDLVFKVYGDFSQTKQTLVLAFFLLGFTDKGALTLTGPGLVQIFGLQLGTELSPYKGISLFLGYIIVPIFSVTFSAVASPHLTLILLSAFSALTLLISIKFYISYAKKKEFPKNQMFNKQ